MRNILFLTSNYVGKQDASGICAENIIYELEKSGNNVYVVCYEGDNQSPHKNVLFVRKDNRGSIFAKGKRAIQSFFSPYEDNNLIKRFFDVSLKAIEKYGIDTVVSVYFPLENASVLKKIKRAIPSVNTILLELDSVGDGIYSFLNHSKIAIKNYELHLNKCYRFVDKIIVMKGHEKYWLTKFGTKYRSKLIISDIPVFIGKINTITVLESKKRYSFVYSGLLGSKYRSPAYMLPFFDKLSKTIPLKLDLFTRGDCEDEIRKYSDNNSQIIQNGYVDSVYLDSVINNSDILISIGNKGSNSLPSKLISYFSFCKPIIHFCSSKTDICIQYLDRYPLGLVLYESDSLEHNISKVKRFISSLINKRFNCGSICDSFAMNHPNYSSTIILNCLSN